MERISIKILNSMSSNAKVPIIIVPFWLGQKKQCRYLYLIQCIGASSHFWLNDGCQNQVATSVDDSSMQLTRILNQQDCVMKNAPKLDFHNRL